MSTFTPPANPNGVPPTLPKGDPAQTILAERLFRHYRSRPEGRNVYIYSDNSVSETDPDGTFRLWSRDYIMGDTLPTAIFVSKVFYGGHGPYDLTAAQATLLTNAGYTVDP